MCFCVEVGYGQQGVEPMLMGRSDSPIQSLRSEDVPYEGAIVTYSITYSPTGIPMKKQAVVKLSDNDLSGNHYEWKNNQWEFLDKGYLNGRRTFKGAFFYPANDKEVHFAFSWGESGMSSYFTIEAKDGEYRTEYNGSNITLFEKGNTLFKVTYNLFGKPVSIKYYLTGNIVPQPGEEHFVWWEAKYEYNAAGNVTLFRSSQWSHDTASMIETSKEVDTYDKQGRLTKYENYVKLENYFKDEFVYESDREREIIHYEYVGNGSSWGLKQYTVTYPNGLTQDITVNTKNSTVDEKNKGSFDLTLNISSEDVKNGFLTLVFPKGFQLDKENTQLLDLANRSFTLNMTQKNDSVWQVSISPKTLRNESPILRQQQAVSWIQVAYTVDKSLAKGNYDIKVNDIAFETTDGNTVFEPEVKASIEVRRSPLSIEKIETSATMEVRDNNLYIQADRPGTVQIYTVNGLMLYNKRIEAGTTGIDISHLNQQILIVTTSYGLTKKFIR